MVARFHFRLEQVLVYRRQLEEQAMQALAEATTARDETARRIEAMEADHMTQMNRLGNPAAMRPEEPPVPIPMVMVPVPPPSAPLPGLLPPPAGLEHVPNNSIPAVIRYRSFCFAKTPAIKHRHPWRRLPVRMNDVCLSKPVKELFL